MAADADRLKACCARFYEHPALRALLGDVFHPGGLRATEELGRRLALGREDRVLDVACGPGRAAAHLAAVFGCRVTGVDYSADSAREARRAAGGSGGFAAGDAERLPFRDASFDVVVIECSLCLVPGKAAAAGEMWRVLRPGGRIGVADVALEDPLPAEVRARAAWLACLGGADPADGYRRRLIEGGFADVTTVDASWALTDAVGQARRLLFLADAARGLRLLPELPMTPAEARHWLDEAERWVVDGRAKYVLVTGRRPRPGVPARV